MATLRSSSSQVSLRPSAGSARRAPLWRLLLLPASLAAGLLLWEVLARAYALPAFILPLPGLVWQRFWQTLADGRLLFHTGITLGEVLAGLALGLATASVLGYLIAKSPGLERALTPYIVASQAVPIIAIAPLLIIWFGPGLRSKVLICALIVFFPILINTVVGLRSVEPELRDLLRSLRASRWQTFAKLELPAALPILLGGLKVGATLAVIGAVVGEFVGSDRGLGFLLLTSTGTLDGPLVWAALIVLIAMGVALFAIVSKIERLVIPWHVSVRTEDATAYQS